MARFDAIVVLASWVAFGFLFVGRRRRSGADLVGPARRDALSIAGVFVVGVSFFLVWDRPRLSPSRAGPVLVFVAPIAVLSVAFANWAVRTLGDQWSIQARLKQDHQLITAGPYAIVRHPIYTSMGLGTLPRPVSACVVHK